MIHLYTPEMLPRRQSPAVCLPQLSIACTLSVTSLPCLRPFAAREILMRSASVVIVANA